MSLWYFAAASAAGVGLVTLVLKSKGTDWQLLHDYQYNRIFTFLDPSQDPLGQGITSPRPRSRWIGRAGRAGWMQGTQAKLNFLPEKHTDFIFTTFAEDFGFMGSIALLILYAMIVVFCFASAISNRDRFGALMTGDRGDVLPVLLGQHGDGDGADAGGGRAAAAGLLRGSAMLVLLAAFGLVQSAHVHRPRGRE